MPACHYGHVRKALARFVCALAVCALAAPQAAVAASPTRPVHPFRALHPAALQAAKQSGQSAANLGDPVAALAAPQSAGPRAWISNGLNQPGLGATDNSGPNDGTPPDPTGAVGTTHYVEFVNSKVGRYDKTTLAQVGPLVDLDVFVGDSGGSVFDPQIQWDPAAGTAGRWLYVADDCPVPNKNCAIGARLAYGFSQTADPTGAWCNYFIASGTTLFDDYPKLGHNDGYIIIGTNVFDSAKTPPNDFAGSRVWTVAKTLNTTTACPAGPTPHFYSGAPSALNTPGATYPADALTFAAGTSKLQQPDGHTAFTPVPADTMEASANGYVVAADDPFVASEIAVWHVDNTGALIADSVIAASSYGYPNNVPQPGSTDPLDSSDTRLTQAVAKTDTGAAGGSALAIWTQHTINGPGNRSVDRWYELTPTLATKKQQEGNVSDPTSFVFNGAISPTMAGNEAVIQYNVGGSSQLAQLRANSLVGSLPGRTMTGELTLGTSTNADRDFTCPSPATPQSGASCRWGDYAAVTPDPAAGQTHRVWGTNQLIGPARPSFKAHWTTRNFALIASGGPTASFTMTPNPVFTGTVVNFNSSASFDPDGGTLTFDWDLDGNGTFETLNTASPTHIYSTPGTVVVTLRVTDSDQGAQDITTRTLTVKSSVPTASVTASPGTVTRPQVVTFDGSGSRDAEAPGGIASYLWDFDGNGTTDQTTTSPTVTHVYTSLGTFNAKLIVKDADEGQSSAPASVPVVVQNATPTARLTVSPAAPNSGENVTLSGAGSTDPDGTIARYQWDLDGNGSFETDTGTVPTAVTSFSTGGNFPVALQVTDSDGAISTTTARVVVNGPLPPPFTFKMKMPRKALLTAIVHNGLTGTATCSAPCRLVLTLRIAKIARKVGKLKKNSVIGTATVNLDAGAKVVRIKLTPTARRSLKKPFSVGVMGTAKDLLGRSATARATVRLVR
jgi:PKD repeat protein